MTELDNLHLVIEVLRDNLYRSEAKHRWVDCDERMPPDSRPVIVAVDWGYAGAVLIGSWDCDIGKWFMGINGTRPKHDVTHWMPTPEPPTKEKPPA